MKLTQQQRDFIALVGRSLKGEDWAPVVDKLWNFSSILQCQVPELVKIDTEGKRIGLTDEGKVVLRWLV